MVMLVDDSIHAVMARPDEYSVGDSQDILVFCYVVYILSVEYGWLLGAGCSCVGVAVCGVFGVC